MTRVILPYDVLLDDIAGWRPLQQEMLNISIATGQISLRTKESLNPEFTEPNGTLGGLTLPRGVAIHRDDIYIANAYPGRDEILRWRPCCGPASPLPTIGGSGTGSRQLRTPSGLTISHRGDLVIADRDNHRILIFTLPELALRRIIGPYHSTEGDPWRPVDVASGPEGSLWVADDTNHRIWQLDRQGTPSDYYAGRLPEGFTPLRVVVDRYGRAIVLVERNDQAENGFPRLVVLLDKHGQSFQEIESPDQEIGPEAGETLRSVLPETRLRLSGDIVLLESADSKRTHAEPHSTNLSIDETGRLLVPEQESGPYLIHRPPVATFETEGVFRIQPLDSGRVANQWHRLVLDMHAPERTSIRVYSFTSEVPRPDLVAVDPDDPGQGPVNLLAQPPRLGPWQAAPANADEWLVQSPPGRYLYLALVFKGAGDNTPMVSSIYVYRQRESSLKYLPAVYQADETSRHLLDRLLSLLDTIYEEIETEIEDFPRHLDVAGAPADFLPWLASWFDLNLKQDWTTPQSREFLRNIVELYQSRGTVHGMRRTLQLHSRLSDPMPQIIEHYRASHDSDEDSEAWTAAAGAMNSWLGPPVNDDGPHHFSVVVPGYSIEHPDKRAAARQMIDSVKPAHAHYTLRPISSGVRLGSSRTRGTIIGVDSLLGSHTGWQLPGDHEEEGILGTRTLLPSSPRNGGAGIRLGSTRLSGIPWRRSRTHSNGEAPKETLL
jgi:phage tail-like protein